MVICRVKFNNKNILCMKRETCECRRQSKTRGSASCVLLLGLSMTAKSNTSSLQFTMSQKT